MQTVIVLALFIAAIVYAGWMIYKNLTTKKNCGTACKCMGKLATMAHKEKS